MKKEMSSFDVRSIVAELAALEGAHMDKVFQWGAGNALFRINVSGQGKRDLFLKDRRWLYLAPEKPETAPVPTSFATYMRKYIDNARIGTTVQAGFDRIVVMELFKADAEYKLIFELFGGGNVILVLDGRIANCLVHKTYRDRATRPGEEYVLPAGRFDPMTATAEGFLEVFRSSAADTVRTLATVANLGGQYAEEICMRAGVDKGTPQAELGDEGVAALYAALQEVKRHAAEDVQPTVFLEDGAMVDLAPMDLSIYEGRETRRFETLSLAIDAYLGEVGSREEEAREDPETGKLKRRIARQQDTVDEYRDECEELKRHADALYTEYGKVTELLEVLKQQSEKLTWDKLREGAMRIPFVRSVDPSRNLVTATVGGLDVGLDYTMSLDANASAIYGRSKDIGERGRRAEEALAASEAELEKRLRGIDRARKIAETRVQPTRQFWFERYKWFITSSGKLVIAGRDAHTNDNVVKRRLKEDDIYVHADVHGAPSAVLKGGKDAVPGDLREACNFSLAHSKSWIAALTEGSAFWVWPDQVSKTPNPGEFLARGAFVVRGKRNYEHHLPMELGIGEIEFQGSRKVMCGPVDAVRSCKRRLTIRPGRVKGRRMAGEIARMFQVPEEEISRILPPGEVEIAEKVWTEETEG